MTVRPQGLKSNRVDCREDFLAQCTRTIRLGTMSEFDIVRPLIFLNKIQIIELGLRLGAPLHLTWSCYVGGKKPCGHCDSCLLRAAGFTAVGIPDPALLEIARLEAYRSRPLSYLANMDLPVVEV
jgi:7-cyano-7-deazaguanine synthase in queuosine biosynthesis